MKLTKNEITAEMIMPLQKAINLFLTESQCPLNKRAVLQTTLSNIFHAVDGTIANDLWILGDEVDAYALCSSDYDADGERIYTAYQLWIHPKHRTGPLVQKAIRFLKFYAQKQGYARMYVVSSRLDNIRGYSRGLGKGFKVSTVSFVNEF